MVSFQVTKINFMGKSMINTRLGVSSKFEWHLPGCKVGDRITSWWLLEALVSWRTRIADWLSIF